MIDDLIFEQVGDINIEYPYICVYRFGMDSPFMGIGITSEKQLAFTFYAESKNISLSVAPWDEIARRGRVFLPRAIADHAAE